MAADSDDRTGAGDTTPERPLAEQPPGGGQRPTGGDAERFGPLELRRMAKDDGRALIIYAAAPDGRARG